MPSTAGIVRSATEALGHGAPPAVVGHGAENARVFRPAERCVTSVDTLLDTAVVATVVA